LNYILYDSSIARFMGDAVFVPRRCLLGHFLFLEAVSRLSAVTSAGVAGQVHSALFAPICTAGRKGYTTMRPDPYRDDPDLMTTEDVAETLRVSKKSVYALIHSGQLKSFRRGRHFRIRSTDLLAYQESLARSDSDDKFNIELPQSIIDSFARHLVTEIRKYYDSEGGQTAFADWLKQQEEGN